MAQERPFDIVGTWQLVHTRAWDDSGQAMPAPYGPEPPAEADDLIGPTRREPLGPMRRAICGPPFPSTLIYLKEESFTLTK